MRFVLSFAHILTLLLFLSLQPSWSEESATPTPSPGAVTADILEAKIKEVEAATDANEETKAKLVELYRKALSNLQTASSNQAIADDFRRAKKTAPAELKLLREAADAANTTLPEETLKADASTPLRQVEQLLQKEKADLAAVAQLLEDDFKSARETIEIGGLSQDRGHMLYQQRQSLPDRNTLRRQAAERRDEASQIGLQRLQHRRNSKRLQNLDGYVAEITAEAGSEATPELHTQIGDLAKKRRAMLN